MMGTKLVMDGVIKGDHRSIARAISIIENGEMDTRLKMMESLFEKGGMAQVVGITGPPGIGKSTTIGNIASIMSENGNKVAVIAIDASSPFSGGSLLGNRIRMQEKLTEKNIYMRSLANRGSKGGLSRSAIGAVAVLDAAGFDTIIMETVGAGQADLDVMEMADTICLILAPGLGDEIQAIKAGIMEIADIYAVNKMDREGSYFALKDIEDLLSIERKGDYQKRVFGITNTDQKTYLPLIEEIRRHRSYLEEKKLLGSKRRRTAVKWYLEEEIEQLVVRPFLERMNDQSRDNVFSLLSRFQEDLRELTENVTSQK
ncbi:methylmalonyl Co-A mutase-associated GTPase MeaB [Caldiplasma sukawensis]